MPIALGSSLISKSSPGGKLRELAEAKAQQAAQAGGGEIGTVQRSQIEEPLERPVSPGSQKVVSSTPAIEGIAYTPDQVDPLTGGNGIGLDPTVGSQPLRSGANNQSLFAGSPQGAPSSPGRSGSPTPGATASTTSIQTAAPRVATAYRPAAAQAPSPSPTPAPNQNVQSRPNIQTQLVTKPLIGNLGIKAYAAEGAPSNKPIVVQQPVQATTGQYLAGGAGRAISALGSLINNQQVKQVGNNLQSVGGQRPQGVTTGSVSQGVRSVAQNVGNTVNNLRSQATNAVNNLLRSLTGGKKK